MNLRKRNKTFFLSLAGLLVLSCGGPSGPSKDASVDDPVELVLAVAQEYVDGYAIQFPEEATIWGFENPPLHRLSDYSPSSLAAWQSKEDRWLENLQGIDPKSLADSEAAAPFGFLLEILQASRDRRVCRFELWSMNHVWPGWPTILPATFSNQEIGTDEARAALLERARDVARFVDTEIGNLRDGLSRGYVAPKSGVEAMLKVVEGLLEGTPEESPFYNPAVRYDSEGFAASLLTVITKEINPAIRRYRDFLNAEYLPVARDTINVTDTPGGEACYSAAVRFYTSMDLTPEEIHKTGLREIERLHEEMRVIGRRSFGIDDPKELLEDARSNASYRFTSEQEILNYAQEAVERSRAAVPRWFNSSPKARVVVKPYPAYLKITGAGQYIMGTPDGKEPGTYRIGTYDPKSLGRAEVESIAFHETYPGHHFQVMLPFERGVVHPVLRYFWIEAVGEGWALYSERLADELGLYSSELSRLGRLSTEAQRASRLVVDPGMHAFGWTRQQAIDYMLENTSKSEGEAIYEIDRYIAQPGQAVAYMIGSLEIQRMRRLAEERLGDRFDIRAFHDAVIGDGTLPFEMLRHKIERWIENE